MSVDVARHGFRAAGFADDLDGLISGSLLDMDTACCSCSCSSTPACCCTG